MQKIHVLDSGAILGTPKGMAVSYFVLATINLLRRHATESHSIITANAVVEHQYVFKVFHFTYFGVGQGH